MMNEIHYKDAWGGIEEMYGEDKNVAVSKNLNIPS
jgi:hypothetical protein